MPNRHLYIFIGESFGKQPKVSVEVLHTSLHTSLALAKYRSWEGLVKVCILATIQTTAIMWAMVAWPMFLVAVLLTIKQLKTIRKLNVDLASYVGYRDLVEKKVYDYGREADYFAGSPTFRTIH